MNLTLLEDHIKKLSIFKDSILFSAESDETQYMEVLNPEEQGVFPLKLTLYRSKSNKEIETLTD